MARGDQEMEVLGHASQFALMLFYHEGDWEGREYGEGVTDVHLGMYGAVWAMLGQW